jgi:hypothetical protein
MSLRIIFTSGEQYWGFSLDASQDVFPFKSFLLGVTIFSLFQE